VVEEAKSWPVRVTQGVRRFRRGVSDWISSDTGAPRESYQLYTQRCNPKRMIQLGGAAVTKVGGQAGWASKRMGGCEAVGGFEISIFSLVIGLWGTP